LNTDKGPSPVLRGVIGGEMREILPVIVRSVSDEAI